MKLIRPFPLKLATMVTLLVRTAITIVIAALVAVLASAQDETNRKVGLPDDWSHQHLIFSNPGTAEQAMQNGTYDRWLRIQNDPRFLMQQVKRYARPPELGGDGPSLATDGSTQAIESGGPEIIVGSTSPPISRHQLHGDWSMDNGSGAVVAAGQYPAKFSFSTTQAYCDSDPTPDFVVYPSGLAGTTETAATGTITFSAAPATSGTNYLRIQSIQYFFTVSSGSVTAPSSPGQCNISTGGVENTAQTNLFGAISTPASGTASTYLCTGASNSAVTNVTNSLASHTITMTATNGDFTLSEPVGNISGITESGGTGGVIGEDTIIAYDNLYSGCSAASGLKPLVYWQYNTAGGTVTTSPVLSEDGSQVAFIETSSAGVASLVILKWAHNPVFVTLANTAASSYRTCTAPCMTVLALNGNPTDTLSSPFYDYGNDVLYVGDDSGILHKFTNIFLSGTPAEITGGGTSSGWPQNIDTAAGDADELTSPVFDSTSGNVLVFISGNADTMGAKLARIPAAGGSSNIVISAQLGAGGGKGFLDSPLVDSTAGTVYGFLDHRFSSANAGVVQLTTTFATGAAGTSQPLGQSTNGAARFAYDGTFDNIYYNSGNPPSGNIYACGRAAASNTPTLYQIPITSNVLGTPVTGPALAGAAAADCSPVAEFFNSTSSIDWIFLGQTGTNRTATPISCPTGTGCVMNFNVTSASGFGTSTATTATALEASGTSGIIIDNSLSSPSGTSQVYFSPLANQTCGGNNGVGSQGEGGGGCDVQASQAALQ